MVEGVAPTSAKGLLKSRTAYEWNPEKEERLSECRSHVREVRLRHYPGKAFDRQFWKMVPVECAERSTKDRLIIDAVGHADSAGRSYPLV